MRCSPIVKNNLGQVAMVRMAIDVSAGMAYLASAGFVVWLLMADN